MKWRFYENIQISIYYRDGLLVTIIMLAAIANIVQQTIDENTRIAQNQDDYQRRYDEQADRYRRTEYDSKSHKTTAHCFIRKMASMELYSSHEAVFMSYRPKKVGSNQLACLIPDSHHRCRWLFVKNVVMTGEIIEQNRKSPRMVGIVMKRNQIISGAF